MLFRSAVEEFAETAAAAATCPVLASDDDTAIRLTLMVTRIKGMVVGYKWSCFKVRVCLLSCAEEVCFKNIKVAQPKKQD